jgi:formylglycine-generating enzyme required for sulfatase activity
VEVDAFYLGVYEVTQAEWQQVMGTNPSAQQGAAGDDSALLPVRLPVERVSWEDCQVFIEKLNEQVPGGGFRLPTEAEWEFACRSGGEVSLAPEELNLRAWYYGNSPRAQARPSAFPVGIRTPNAWGLFDMQGNVSEWCADLLRPYLADRSEAPESGDSRNLRVLRGGSYNDGATGLHPAMRHGERPHRRLRWNGLRLARSVPE